MSEQRIKVINPKDGWRGTECYINEQKIGNVKSVDFHVAVDEVPTFQFETIGLPDIDMNGAIEFSFSPETVQQASIVLQNEFKTNSNSFKALVSSIASVLNEVEDGEWMDDVAKRIARRIAGIEN